MCVRSVTVIILENDTTIWVQILDESVGIPHSATVHEEKHESNFSRFSYGYIVGLTNLFNLDTATDQGEEKL